jgi:CheY-like chemotaxis protein
MIAMSHPGQRGAHAAVAPSTPILIVDHDRGISTSLAFMLSARGYDEVRAVRSAARAIAVAAKFHPGIVFLDIERSETESLDLATLLRRGAGHHAMRLIALTGSVEPELRDEARAAGFERYLAKPLSQVELDKVLRLPRTAAE